MAGPTGPQFPGRTAGSSAGSSTQKGGQTNPAPDGTRAWTDLRNAVGNHLPRQLNHSRINGMVAWQILHHRRKVGR